MKQFEYSMVQLKEEVQEFQSVENEHLENFLFEETKRLDFLESCFPNIKKHTKRLESDVLTGGALMKHTYLLILIFVKVFLRNGRNIKKGSHVTKKKTFIRVGLKVR